VYNGLIVKRILQLFIMMLILSQSAGWCQMVQTVDVSSSPNPVGSGARALGMGGAFIGVADDATAASWNPGGLIQLETPEVSMVGAYNMREEDTSYVAFPEASGPQDVTTYEMNYLSLAYPFSASGTNMIVSLNIQHLYDFDKRVSFAYSYTDNVGPPFSLDDHITYVQEGAFKPTSPAIAVQITPYISLGLAVNFWDYSPFDNEWKSEYRGKGDGLYVGYPFNVNTQINEKYSINGLRIDLTDPFHWYNVNFNVGILWQLNSKLNLGIVFKSPFDAQLDHDYHFQSSIIFPTAPASNSQSETSFRETVKLRMPMSYGIGLAYRWSDFLTFDLDAYRTDWSNYVLVDADGYEQNPVTGEPQKEAHVTDTIQIRFGGEYLLIGEESVIPIRAGIFYDPEQAKGSPDDFFGFSIGSGIAYKNIVYDIAYQYRFGRDVRPTVVGGADSSQDVDQHTVYMSLIYHF
jgi:long-subunit fatty acid transport protein